MAQTITSQVGGETKERWLAETVAITAGTLSPAISQAADLWGRKWLVVGFTVAGAVGCLIVSRADNFGTLIAGQCMPYHSTQAYISADLVTAIGALPAGVQCLIHAIASEIMPRKWRTIAQAATATAGGLGGVVGALLSGGLVRTDPTNWRIFFYIIVGLYVASFLTIVFLYNPPPRELQTTLTQQEKLARLDWIGNALFIPGLVLFGFALTSSTGIYPWKSAKIIAPLVVGAVLLILFILYEWLVKKDGMLHHGVFTNGRNFPLVFGLFFMEGLVFFATNSFYSFEVAVVYGKELFIAGAYYALGFAILIVVSQITGVYCAKTKTIRGPLVVAFLSFSLFLALMATLKTDYSAAHPLGYVVFFGIGIGISLNALTATAQLSTPKELIAIATGLVIGVRSVGGTVGLSIFSAVFSSTQSTQIPAKVGAAVSGFPQFNPKNTGALLAGILSGNSTLLGEVAGVSPGLIDATGAALREANLLSFRNVWITAAALCATTAVGKLAIDTLHVRECTLIGS